VEAVTAGGLQADIMADTGLDIGLVRYKGNNVSFLSKNGYDSRASFSAAGHEFLYTFPGGLLYTCGLRSTGAPSIDGDEYHPMHGRIHGQPATNLVTCIKEDNLIIEGVLKESALFGHALELRRRITLPVWGSKILIEDTIENLTPYPEELAVLYHFNFGYPLLSENTKLILPEDRQTTPRTEYAKTGLGKECEFSAPIDGEEEQVYFHELSDGRVKLENAQAGIAMTLHWNLDNLPILAQWKSMASGDYALGLEPTNNFIMGRFAERENGTLKVLDAFDSVEMRLELEFETI